MDLVKETMAGWASCYFPSIPDVMVVYALALVTLTAWAMSAINLHLLGPKAPLIGSKLFYEPRLLANFRFFRSPKAILDEGYSRVG